MGELWVVVGCYGMVGFMCVCVCVCVFNVNLIYCMYFNVLYGIKHLMYGVMLYVTLKLEKQKLVLVWENDIWHSIAYASALID